MARDRYAGEVHSDSEVDEVRGRGRRGEPPAGAPPPRPRDARRDAAELWDGRRDRRDEWDREREWDRDRERDRERERERGSDRGTALPPYSRDDGSYGNGEGRRPPVHPATARIQREAAEEGGGRLTAPVRSGSAAAGSARAERDWPPPRDRDRRRDGPPRDRSGSGDGGGWGGRDVDNGSDDGGGVRSGSMPGDARRHRHRYADYTS